MTKISMLRINMLNCLFCHLQTLNCLAPNHKQFQIVMIAVKILLIQYIAWSYEMSTTILFATSVPKDLFPPKTYSP